MAQKTDRAAVPAIFAYKVSRAVLYFRVVSSIVGGTILAPLPAPPLLPDLPGYFRRDSGPHLLPVPPAPPRIFKTPLPFFQPGRGLLRLVVGVAGQPGLEDRVLVDGLDEHAPSYTPSQLFRSLWGLRSGVGERVESL